MSTTPNSPAKSQCSRKWTASRSSGTRKPGTVRWIVLHDAEAKTAESAARFFANPAPPPPVGNGPAGSAHLCVDDNVCFRTLDNDAVPWAATSAFNCNLRGFHIEQAGFAKWSATAWMLHRDTLRRAAYKTALHCVVFNLPPVFVLASQLPNVDGVTTHREVTMASKRLDPAHASRYTHTDPGPLWPRRWFMARVREYHAELLA